MKYFILSVVLLFVSTSGFAQTWQWANSSGSTGDDLSYWMDKDANDNIYIGINADNGTYHFNNSTISINGWNDMILAKYDQFGNEVWQKKFGGDNNDMIVDINEDISDVTYDAVTNSIIVAGNYVNNMTLGCGVLNGASNYQLNAFIAKLDLNGNCVWSHRVGDIAPNVQLGSADVDQNGNVYIMGSCGYYFLFGSDTIERGVFIAKYDSQGNELWGKSISPRRATSIFYFGDLKCSNSGILITGLNDTDSLIIDTIKMNYPNNNGKVIAKLDFNLNGQWVKQFAGPTGDYSSAYPICLDLASNIYITGAFKNQFGVFNQDTITANITVPLTSMYLAKFDSSGNYIWSKGINSSGQSSGLSLVHSTINNNIYVTGGFIGNAQFNNFSVVSNSPTNIDYFLAQYDTAGNCTGISHDGTGIGTEVKVDNSGQVYLLGLLNGSMTFNTTSLTSWGVTDIFLAKHDAVITGTNEDRVMNNILQISANPNKGNCSITIPDVFLNADDLVLSIYDMQGKKVYINTHAEGQNEIALNMSTLAKGMYTILLSNGRKSFQGKVIIN